MRRSNQLVLAGIAFFIVGVVIVLLVARSDNSGSSTTGANVKVPVLVATDNLAVGTKGSDAIAKVEVKQVNAIERLPDALSSPSQLSSTRLVAAFAKGEQIRQSGLTPTVSSVTAPKGMEAVPVSVPFEAGGAGYIGPGDVVNVYQVIPDPRGTTGPTPAYDMPRVKLLLTKVQVLDVNTQIASLAGQATTATTQQVQSRPAGGGPILLVLALDTADAEKVIFGSRVSPLYLYFTKVDKDSNPAGPTSGQDLLSILAQEANQAYAESPKP